MKAGRFREDLFYRLNTVEIAVPPLRERREDVLPLARRFLDFFARSSGRAGAKFTEAAEKALTAYDWPGNVRELRNAVERAAILAGSGRIDADALPGRIAAPARAAARDAELGGDITLEKLEREHIERVLTRAGSLERAAEILGIDPSTLYRKRKRYESGEAD